MKTIVATASLLILAVLSFGFKLPDSNTRRAAIGSLTGVSVTMKRALRVEDFEPINAPGPHDWLANHPERGQTYDQYLHQGFVRPDKQRRKIYLLPIGEFAPGRSPALKTLQAFMAAYFSMEVTTLAGIPLAGQGLSTRINSHSRKQQVLAGDILDLLKTKLPADAFCILGITMTDLYPADDWNFVFGMASLKGRVGVFSFARYDPTFHDQKQTRRSPETLLRRSMKVMAHETAHMFSLAHCTFFQCLVNGSNHLQESDSRPIHLCPVCLRKLQHNIGFAILPRYRALLDFYRRVGFSKEADWVQARLDFIGAK